MSAQKMPSHKNPPHVKPFLSEGIYSLLIVLILLFTLVAASRIFTNKPSDDIALQWPQYPVAASSVASDASTNMPVANTAMTVEVLPPPVTTAPDGLDYPRVQGMIDAVSFSESGEITITGEGRARLDEAVIAVGMGRSTQELNAIHQAIENYLPADKARRVSELFENYYSYKTAEQDFMGDQYIESPEDSAKHYEALRALRINYLGEERAAKLFKEEDEFMKSTLAAMHSGQAASGASE